MDLDKAIQFLTESAARTDAKLALFMEGVKQREGQGDTDMVRVRERLDRHDAQLAALIEISARHDSLFRILGESTTRLEDTVEKLAHQVQLTGSHMDLMSEELLQRDAATRAEMLERDARLEDKIGKLAEALRGRNGHSQGQVPNPRRIKGV